MVLCGITLVSLVEELRAVGPVLLSSFYADDGAFDILAGRGAQLLKIMMKKGPDQGVFP